MQADHPRLCIQAMIAHPGAFLYGRPLTAAALMEVFHSFEGSFLERRLRQTAQVLYDIEPVNDRIVSVAHRIIATVELGEDLTVALDWITENLAVMVHRHTNGDGWAL